MNLVNRKPLQVISQISLFFFFCFLMSLRLKFSTFFFVVFS